jgi:D-aminoacyl-tRNA deacylase
MNFTILASKKDMAALNIARELNSLNIDAELIEHQSIYAENIDAEFSGDFIIFVSMHKSEKEVRTLTLHAPGNWKQADFGGKPGEVCRTSSLFLKHVFKILNQKTAESKLDYQVSLEVTHHGPYLEKPCCFIEIGSTEREWMDDKASKVIAETLNDAMFSFKPDKELIPSIGIGGPHYCPNFNKIQLNSQYAISHIIPEYALPLTEQMLLQAITKTTEPVKTAILDWKAIGNAEERKNIISLLDKHKIQAVRSEKIK